MESKQSTPPSVMARLMRLDELPQPQEAVQKPQRVLSENYLWRVASIGVGKKHSLRKTLEEKKQIKDVCQVVKTLKEDEHAMGKNSITPRNRLVNEKPQTPKNFQDSLELVDSKNGHFQTYIPYRNSLLSKPTHGLQASIPLTSKNSTSIRRNVDTHRKRKSTKTELGYLRPRQILENSSTVTGSHQEEFGLRFYDFSRSQLGTQDEAGSPDRRIVVLKPMPIESGFSGRYFSLPCSNGNALTIKSGLSTPPICSSDLTKQCQSAASSNNSHTFQKQLSERYPMSKKGSSLNELFVIQNHDSRPKNRKPNSRRHGLKNLDLSKFSKQQSKYEAFRSKLYLRSADSLNWARCKLRKHNIDQEGSEAKDLKLNSEKYKFLPCLDSVSSCSDMEDRNALLETWVRKDKMKHKLDDGNMFKQNVMLTKVADVIVDAENKFAVKPSVKSEYEQIGEDDDFSSCATDTSLSQDKPIGFHEESSDFSRCSGTELDSLVSLEEAYQPTPTSVLEPPFSEEAIISSEFLGMVKGDICDLRRHLELLKSEDSETYSDGSGMAVSSDDESEEKSAGHSKGDEVTMKIFIVEESRNFSYLVDVLAEASFHCWNLEEFGTWHSLDCPISLSVFETLEKKYGEQMSWKRSERRLLFDRMNEGLMEIILPCIGVPAWKKSVSRRLSSVRDEEMIQEDLWRLLVSQEKECCKSSAETLLESELGKLDLGDEIDAIGTEIERLLFDELMAEFFF
ncbi:hypothetical protein L484_025427 [Morus notabilis]|uniref:DUF4378 domain-containing protein n=1 Tax=Morus notabilis TaxID=981085 RepID=W9R2B6_9ROSA|nr:uncharacterized protein LOC21408128 [Morus notabilis]EXB65346.1 hypothetical protein L484_025427 [Morus notabilis]